MSNEMDPEKLEEQLRLSREAFAVIRKLLDAQGKRIANLEDWVKRLEEKLAKLLPGD